MVKFSLIALVSALATANAGTSRHTIKLGDRKLRRGEASTEALLKKARPYKKGGARKLANDDDFEVDGSYSLKFSECVDVRTMDEDLFDEDVVGYVQSGQVVGTTSYVLFHVCQGDNCYYEAEDDLYIVDLPTYLENVATYYSMVRNNYCEACEEFQDYCVADEEEAEGDDAAGADEEDADEAADEGEEEDRDEEEEDKDEEEEDKEDEEEDREEEEDRDEEEDREGEEGEGEDRKLKQQKKQKKRKQRKLAQKKQRRTKNIIDCDMCTTYECYQDEEDLDDGQQARNELDNQVGEWIAQLAQCYETGQQWNGMDLYTSAMCSPYGDGVELAVFVNEECTMYTNQVSFNDVYNPNYNAEEINYLYYAENYIKTAFSGSMSCLEEEFDDPNDENDDQNDEQEYRVNEYCEQVFKEGAVSFNNCQGGNADEEENQDDQYNWYEYDITARNAEDMDEVCYTIQKMEGEYYHTYDIEGSGTWYERNRSGQIIVQGEESQGLSTGAIVGIVIAVIVVVGGVAALVMKPKKQSDSNQPVYQGGTML